MATSEQFIQGIYIAYWGRAADPEGLAYWKGQFGDDFGFAAIAENFATQPEGVEAYDFFKKFDAGEEITTADREQFVNEIYANLFDKDPADDPGELEGETALEYWVRMLEEENTTPGAFIADIMNSALVGAGEDADKLMAKIVVAEYMTAQAVAQGLSDAEAADFVQSDAAKAIIGATTPDNVVAQQAEVDNIIPQPAPTPGDTFYLTLGQDNIAGDGNDNTFIAPIVQNDFGAVVNTLESGDVIDGGGGRNILQADIIDTALGMLPSGPAISPTTTNIHEVYLRAQMPHTDLGGQGAFIDAERMTGVEQWWMENSRDNIRIEDIRSIPADTIFGMRLTDPAVNYIADFNPLWVLADTTEDDSSFTVILQEITDGQDPAATELANVTVRGLEFILNGEAYELDTPEIRAANTWVELQDALADAFADTEGLENLAVTHQGNGVFVITDPDSGSFQVDPEALIISFSGIDVRNRVDIGEPVLIEGLTNTTVVLDAAGNGSQGGTLDIGTMSGLRGIEVFDVYVDRTSHLEIMQSANQILGAASYLQEVYLSHLEGGAGGNFYLGDRSIDAAGFSTTTDDRLDGINGLNNTWGLTDVRLFDASGFTGDIKLGASLANTSIDRYLDPADDVVEFEYIMGEANSILSLDIDNPLSRDSDFQLTLLGGDGDTRFNITNSGAGATWKNSTYVDGGGGDNIVEIDSNTGILPGLQDAFAQFDNIQTLVIAGANNTIQDIVDGNLAGLDNIIIATQNVNTTLRRVDLDDTSVTISGKNQTLGAGNSNNDQNIGVVSILGSAGTDAELLLDNTARLDGQLTVANIIFNDFGAIQSQARTLTIESGGSRQVSNVVQNFVAPRVTELNFEGTQNLAFHVANMATLPVVAGETPPLTVDGSDLEGDLTLAMDATLLTRGVQESIEGTDGDNDILALYGNVVGFDPVVAPTVRGFETLQFGWLLGSDLDDLFDTGAAQAFSGTYNAANTTGVGQDTYIIGWLNSPFALTNLRNGDTVQIGDTSVDPGLTNQIVGVAGQQITLGGTGTLNLNVIPELSALNFLFGAFFFNINGFTNVNFDVDRSNSLADENLFADLTTADSVQTLTLTGGNADENIDITLNLTNALNTALTRVDFSDFEGEVIMPLGWDSTRGTNASIVLNGYDFVFDVGGDNTIVPGVVAPINQDEDLDFTGVTLNDGETLTIKIFNSTINYTNGTGGNLTGADLANAVQAVMDANPNITVVGYVVGDVVVDTIAAGAATNNNYPAAEVFGESVGTVAVTTNFYGANADGDYVQNQSAFITSFVFTEDANDPGVVWEIDNFQAFEAGLNVTLANQSIIDLRPLGVSSATDITIQSGDAFFASFADPQDFIDLYGDPLVDPQAAALQAAGNSVVTSNAGLDYTILLTGVNDADLSNENFAGIAA